MRDPALAELPTLTQLIRVRARHTPDALAFVTLDRSWTFAQVHAASNQMAQGLAALGLGSGDRIGRYTRNSVECVISLLAAAKLLAGTGCAAGTCRNRRPGCLQNCRQYRYDPVTAAGPGASP